jgi:hypothetical protein
MAARIDCMRSANMAATRRRGAGKQLPSGTGGYRYTYYIANPVPVRNRMQPWVGFTKHSELRRQHHISRRDFARVRARSRNFPWEIAI